MKIDSQHIKLYLQIQELHEIVVMPYLEQSKEIITEKLQNLENEIIHYMMPIYVIDKKSRLVNLLTENFLQAEKSMQAFVFRKRIKLLHKSFKTISTDEIPKKKILIIVINDELDLKNMLHNLEHLTGSKYDPLVLILNDADGMVDFEKVKNAVNDCMEKNKVYFANHPLFCMEYSSLNAVEGQTLMDNHLMHESKFFKVKQMIENMTDELYEDYLLPDATLQYRALLNVCRQELESKIDYHRNEERQLLHIKEKLTIFSVNFGEDVRKKCVDVCNVKIEKIQVQQKLDNMVKTKKIVTDIVEQQIEDFFKCQVNGVITENLENVQKIYRDFFDDIICDMFWMTLEEKEKLREKSVSFCEIEKSFQFPKFTMSFNDFTFIRSSMNEKEVEEIVNEAVQKALYRYNQKIHYLVKEWLDHIEDEFSKKIEALIKIINDSVLMMIDKKEQSINEIRSSETFMKIRRLSAYE